jgi:hypothetical protein
LLRHAVLDLFDTRDDEAKRTRVQHGHVAVMLGFYAVTHSLEG